MRSNRGTLILILSLTVLFFSPSCVRKSRFAEMQNQRDSLMVVHQEKMEQLEMIRSYIDTIAASIDSLTHQETILLSRTNADGVKFTTREIRDNLELLEALINRQRSKIYELDSTLVVMQDSTNSLRSVITFLYKQLDEKDNEIQMMRIELGVKNQRIRTLSNQVSALQGDVSELEKKSTAQTEEIIAQNATIAQQDSLIYTAYYIVDTRKGLKDKGILSGNLLTGSRIDIGGIDRSIYTAVDIREFESLEISGQKPKVISPMPSGSYVIETVSNRNHVLTVTDKDSFWGTSKILIIQI